MKGMGVTLVDSLDTLWIMGMKDEFEEAKEWVKNELSFSHADTVSMFETTIRELGGLISAYDLSGDQVFLDKAKELGDLLMPAFDTGEFHPLPSISNHLSNPHSPTTSLPLLYPHPPPSTSLYLNTHSPHR